MSEPPPERETGGDPYLGLTANFQAKIDECQRLNREGQKQSERQPEYPAAIKETQFHALKREYMEKKAAGLATAKDDVDFVMAGLDEQRRLSKARADEEFDLAMAISEAQRSSGLSSYSDLDASGSSRENGISGNLLVSRKRAGTAQAYNNELYVRGPRSKKRATIRSAVESAKNSNADLRKLHQTKLVASLMSNIAQTAQNHWEGDLAHLESSVRALTGTAIVEPFDGHCDRLPIKGMITPLLRYQVLGVAFLRKREQAPDEPKGGILADEMGLGKTLMMLCNIVNGRHDSTAKHKTTLIVTTKPLVNQWLNQIKQHVHQVQDNDTAGLGHVLEYHAGSRLCATNVIKVLESCDVILTTYPEIQRSYQMCVPPVELKDAASKELWFREHFEEHAGPLHRIQWHRAVLDEAQAIKNYKSLTLRACHALNAKHRWLITGTPAQNNTLEFYAHLNFLREPQANSPLGVFRHNFGSRDDDSHGNERLRMLLRKVMLRRVHETKLFGTRLIDLPRRTQHIYWLEFTPFEREFYDICENRITLYIASKSDAANRACNIEKPIRLRQLTGHPLAIHNGLLEFLELGDVIRLFEVARRTNLTQRDAADILAHNRQEMKAKPTSDAGDNRSGPSLVKVTKHLHIPDVTSGVRAGSLTGPENNNGFQGFQWYQYLLDLSQHPQFGDVIERASCCVCKCRPPQKIRVTSCFHVYCAGCLESLEQSAARDNFSQAACSECGTAYTSTSDCTFLAKRIEATVTLSEAERRRRGNAPNGSLSRLLEYPIPPSSKMLTLKAQVLNWLEENPKCKMIIYSEYIDTLRIVASICCSEGWSHELYTGKSSHTACAKILEAFNDTAKGFSILVASLKAGGVGLNLTIATRVILMEPGWNEAIERQASSRVHRVGQGQETCIVHFLIKDTYDENIMDMKTKKQEDIDTIVQDTSKARVEPLGSVMELYGPSRHGNKRRAFIFAGDDDEK